MDENQAGSDAGGFSDERLRLRIDELEKQIVRLKERDELLELIMDNAPIGIAIHQDYIIRYINKENVKLAGLNSPEDAVGQPVFDYVSDDSQGLAKERSDMAYKGTKPISRVLEQFKTITGEARDVVVTTIPFMHEGRPASLVMFSDITSAMDVQRAQQEREASFQSLFENALVGQAMLNTKGEFLTVNSAFCELTGFSSEELLSMGTADLTYSEDLPETMENVKRLLNGEIKSFRIEKRVKKKNGGFFWADLSVGVLADTDGSAVAMLGCVVDINERMEAERKLERSEKLFRAIVEQSGDGISMADESGRYTLVNRAMSDLLGYSREELLDKTVFDMLPPGGEVGQFPAAVAGKSWTFSGELLRKDGSKFWAEVSAFPIVIDDKHQVLGIVRDVSRRRSEEQERIALEGQIQKTQKLESLGVLAGGIAHDFNNLLVGVLGNADLALHDLAPEAPAQRSIKDIITAAERATELVRQMLAYAGKGRFLVEVLDLNAVVEEMTHLLDVSISKKAVLRFDLSREIPSIEADATQVRQVVMNLITNASDAIENRSGVISIRTGAMDCDRQYLAETYLDEELPEGQYVYLEISDTGKGMDDEVRQRVFDPFFSTKFAGRGLGLAAVLGIVRGHGGAVKVYSEKGKGTTFKVLFPSVHAQPRTKTKVDAVTELGKLCGTVLLVDDEETVRSVGRRMIEHLGCQVVTCEDGVEALERFRADPDLFSVVILDLTMPHMDGDVCFRELRRIRSNVKVILSSGYNEAELVARFAGKGLAGFMQKPYRIDTLAEKIGEALEIRK